ncbi:MAG: polysaccharide deacetylase family protein [Lachnospiraceae bacterium]|nr:polysaccharide deacetylase family protein [Lachnospiraceae bacterium]
MKKAYLTIDDGPSVARRQKVDVLTKYGIQAVWFCMGIDMEARQEDALYTIENGQIIGNHSYNHPNFSEIDLEQCEREIVTTDRMIDELYQKAGVKRPVKLFRFPYGNEGVKRGFFDVAYTDEERQRVERIQKVLTDNGYTTFPFENITYPYYERFRETKRVDWLWTYDTMEWCVFQEKPPYGVKTIDDVLEMMEIDWPDRWMGLNYPNSEEIIVIHDHPQTSDMFETIIKALLDKGVEFCRIVE